MKVQTHPIKPGSVIIFNFDYAKMSSSMSNKTFDKFMKSFIKNIKDALPVDSVIANNVGVINSVDIFESNY